MKHIYIFSNDPQDPLRYVFIDNFCGDPDEMNVYQTLTVSANGVGHTVSFSIDSFSFHDNPNLFVHCHTNVCDSSYESCDPDCSNTIGRKRRKRSTGVGGAYLTLGPIRILAPIEVH